MVGHTRRPVCNGESGGMGERGREGEREGERERQREREREREGGRRERRLKIKALQ